MNLILGVLFHFIGGFASGSFYIPYKKVEKWSWESYWLAGGLFSWLLVPALAAWLTIPSYWSMIGSAEWRLLGFIYLFGVLWGVGGLTYGLGVRYLGVSLGNSIILGLCMVFGALIPSLYYEWYPQEGKDTLSLLFSTQWGLVILLGLIVCIIAIIINAVSGMRKEKELMAQGNEGKRAIQNSEYRFGIGLTLAIVSGILSACFNFGLEAGKPLAELANNTWKSSNPAETGNYLFMNNITYVVILWGGLTTNLIWCLFLNYKNKSFKNYTDKHTPLLKNYLFAALAGTAWFLQFFFYGMGESKLGNGASSWILHMAFIILVANFWGLYLKEWKNLQPRTVRIHYVGILVIILSVIIIGAGNSLKN